MNKAPLETGTLHLLCGKIASGKSTLAKQLCRLHNATLISEDSWLALLYPDEIKTVTDYVCYSKRLREAMGPHVIELLRCGVTVVLDFPANTIADRQRLRGLSEKAEADHRLHFLDADDATCLTRLRERNVSGNHVFNTSDADFALITTYFVRPTEDEGLRIVYSI